MKGLKTGKVKVTAQIKEYGYNVPAASVIIYVVEQFILFPETSLYLLPFS